MSDRLNIEQYRKQLHPDLITLGFHTPAESWKFDYPALIAHLKQLKTHNHKQYIAAVRQAAEEDFWFFMFYVLDMPIFHPYLISLAYEIQDNINRPYLYLAAARGSWKSTFLTIGLSIWEVAKDPDVTAVILSYERQMAVKQLLGVKNQCERSPLLWTCWPEVFYSPNEFRSKQTERWNLYAGMFVKRNLKSSDPTFAAYGFIEGIPTGTHFSRLKIDDPVTLDNSATIESLEKVKAGFRMLNGIKDRERFCRFDVATTRYDVNDLSKDILEDRRYYHIVRPAEVDKDGTAMFDGIPVFRSREDLDDERLSYGDAYYAAQMLQNPTLGGDSSLNPDWLRFYEELPNSLNYYIFIDPAGSKAKRADFSVFVVLGVSSDKQFYLIDMVRDKLDVYERYDTLKHLYKLYRPEAVFYEIQGLNSDLEVFEREMRSDKYYMNIDKFSCNTANSKHRRIMALVAMFRKSEFLLPEEIIYNDRDLIQEFIEEEYKKYPHNRYHDDMLDCMSFITQVPVTVPDPDAGEEREYTSSFLAAPQSKNKGSWATQFCTW